MTPPDFILLSDIDDTDRFRSVYTGIEALAEAIRDVGLIEPIIVSERPGYDKPFILNAGGRRLRALRAAGYDRVYHAATCDPDKPGFLLKGESVAFTDVMIELRENLNRDDMLWYDQMRAIVKLKRLTEIDLNANGERLVMRVFAETIGVSYAYVQAANYIHDDWLKNPDDYKAVNCIRNAYTVLANKNKAALIAEQARRLQQPKNGGDASEIMRPTSSDSVTSPTGEVQIVLPSRAEVRFSGQFHRMSGLDYMRDMLSLGLDVNHIITDPDYGVSVERLESNSNNQATGVAQKSVAESLVELKQFIDLAYEATAEHGFLIFFLDLDHWEKCQTWATTAGWRVQRWPLTWKKTDYRSNAAPSHNFCKNEEWAMVCRKPGATLTGPQMSSVFDCPTEGAQKQFGHPFAKPTALWRWLYRAVATPGQTILDPFMGSGSGPCSAIDLDLIPYGTEIQEVHFNSAVVNLKKFYEQKLGPCDFV